MNQIRQDFHKENPIDVLSKGMFHKLFSGKKVLSPQLNEVYELALAYYESRILSEEELLQNGAYFVKIGDQYTRHYHMCTGAPLLLPKHSSSRLRSFFEKNQFRTGYATHGLFPYRGKFHPQMIKALINVMGVKAGDVVLDPMMGSGTVPIEASLMNIRSVGIDASPFCRFMAKTKYDALSLPLDPLDRALEKSREIFDYFSQSVGSPVPGSKSRNGCQRKQDNGIQELKKNFQSGSEQVLPELMGNDSHKVFDLLLLAYLDSAGYSERSKRKTPFEQYKSIIERYVFVVKKIQHVLAGVESIPAEATILQGDARALPLDNKSVDGILFSPPYSFAIDYLANDSFHLNLLGEDTKKLKETMVGLRGKTIKEKYRLYTEDMDCVFSECDRVLKPGRFCSLIIGTNDNQLSKALGIPKEEVKGLHRIMTETAQKYQFRPVRTLARQISGIANTMRNEYIVILQKS
ncbi:MAG: DNA methyltransferase [Desulfovibrionales bacterium]